MRDDTSRQNARQTSLEAGNALRRILETAPAARPQASVDPNDRVSAERVLKLASSFDLHVPAGQVTDADVERRLDELRQPLAMMRDKKPGETVRVDDEVLVDLLGYIGGDVFLAHTDTWYRVVPNNFLPGLFESLVGASVPDHRIATVRLPDDYPVPAQAGRIAVFAVNLKQARMRELPDVEDPLFLPLLSKGVKTLDELRATLRDELVQERGQQMVDHARMLLLRELYIRCMADEVPEELVNEELARRWREFKGSGMVLHGVPLEDQKRSQQAYASDAAVRAEARRTVWEFRILEAVAAHFGIVVTDESLTPVLHRIFGSNADVEKLLYKNPALHKDLIKGLRLRRAAEALLACARVSFDAPPTPANKPIKPLVEPSLEEEAPVVTTKRGLRRPPSKGPQT